MIRARYFFGGLGTRPRKLGKAARHAATTGGVSMTMKGISVKYDDDATTETKMLLSGFVPSPTAKGRPKIALYKTIPTPMIAVPIARPIDAATSKSA
ncbi:MAG: hypothetical protein WB643_13110, partial [Candidatus Bathyarchaeia archaeon]